MAAAAAAAAVTAAASAWGASPPASPLALALGPACRLSLRRAGLCVGSRRPLRGRGQRHHQVSELLLELGLDPGRLLLGRSQCPSVLLLEQGALLLCGRLAMLELLPEGRELGVCLDSCPLQLCSQGVPIRLQPVDGPTRLLLQGLVSSTTALQLLGQVSDLRLELLRH